MCSPKQPQDNSAVIARQQAAEREAAINAGKQKIDSTFSVFDPGYFDKFTKANVDYYNPQADKQFGEAKQKLIYGVARQGIRDSTEAQRQFGDLTNTYEGARREIASNAEDATNKLRLSVDQNKSDLYAQNSASADPSLAGINAVSRANSLTTAPSFSPMGSIFSGLVNAGTSYLAGRNKALPAGYETAFAPGASLPKGGSGRVIS